MPATHPETSRDFIPALREPFSSLGSRARLGAYLLGVVLDVVLAGLFGVMSGMVEVTLSEMGVVPGLLGIAPFMLLGCGQVVLCGEFMMFRRLFVVIDGFLGHVIFSLRYCDSAGCWGSMNLGR
jgi:hypothetical protein